MTSAFYQGPLGPDGTNGQDGDQVRAATHFINFFPFSCHVIALFCRLLSKLVCHNEISTFLVSVLGLNFGNKRRFKLRSCFDDLILLSRVIQGLLENLAS